MMTFVVTFFLSHTKAVHLVGFLELQILRVSWFPGIYVFLNAVNSTEPKICVMHGIHCFTKAELRKGHLHCVVLCSQNRFYF